MRCSRDRSASGREWSIPTKGPASYDPIEPGKAGTTDRGGCVNLLTPGRMVSQNVPGMAPNSCLIEIRKWEA